MPPSGGSDPAADFEALVGPHVDHLYRMAYRFTGRREEAEDLVQDLLVKLYPRVEELARVEQLRPWLTRVLYNQFVDQHRKRSRLRLWGSNEDPEDDRGDPFDRMASDNPGPERAVQDRFTQAQLEEALARLSHEHRAVLALHDMEGYTLVEMTTILEVPTGTLKSRLHRARARIRALLSEDGTF